MEQFPCDVCGKKRVVKILKEGKRILTFCSEGCYKKHVKEQQELWDLHLGGIA